MADDDINKSKSKVVQKRKPHSPEVKPSDPAVPRELPTDDIIPELKKRPMFVRPTPRELPASDEDHLPEAPETNDSTKFLDRKGKFVRPGETMIPFDLPRNQDSNKAPRFRLRTDFNDLNQLERDHPDRYKFYPGDDNAPKRVIFEGAPEDELPPYRRRRLLEIIPNEGKPLRANAPIADSENSLADTGIKQAGYQEILDPSSQIPKELPKNPSTPRGKLPPSR